MIEIASTKGVHFPSGFPKVIGAQNNTNTSLRTSHPLHMQVPTSNSIKENTSAIQESSSSMKSFGDFLKSSIENVEGLDAKSNELSNKAIYDPESVEVHDVLLASEKARFALNFTKTLSDGLIRTFKELTNPR